MCSCASAAASRKARSACWCVVGGDHNPDLVVVLEPELSGAYAVDNFLIFGQGWVERIDFAHCY
jgi:hypothetical protein